LYQNKNKFFMKGTLLLACIFIASVLRTSAYTVVTVKDSISTNTHWTCDKQYLLNGYVYVTSGATLTIDAGCIIKGDKNSKGSLIIERGAKIIANGTATSPIVFTSNQAAGNRTYGDWGGVILCGKSLVNWNGGQSQVEGGPRSLYGGTDTHDNSGEMHYVRIEFAGIAFSPNNEINGLTFCGVGDATQIDHIQVSYSGDDSYEWFGGSVNGKYMVAFAGWDDDFDTDNGYTGMNQFMVGIRDPFAADQSGSKGFESDSYQSGTATGLAGDTSQITKCVFSNCTMIGPLVSPVSTAYDPQFVSGAHIRRGSGISILNSIIAGYPAGVLFDESSSSFGSTVGNIGNGIMQFRNNIICGTSTVSTPNPKYTVFVNNGARSLTPTTANADTTSAGTNWMALSGFSGPVNFINNPSFGNATYATEQTGVRLGNPFNLSNPGLVPTSTSPIVYNATHTFHPLLPINYDTSGGYVNYNVPGFAPDFVNNKANNAFFTKVNYAGAFSGTGTTSDNWMNGWCEFNPNNAFYETTCYVAPPIDTTTGISVLGKSAFGGVKLYPNPATDKATLLLDITQAGLVKATVLDINGRIVKEIFTGELTTGTKSIDFTTSELSGGIYLISINASNKQRILKFTVIK
jgi:hypothetical protein